MLRNGGAGGATGVLVSLFSEAAIVTSFIGFVIGLVDFFTDVFPNKSKKDLALYGAVLLPPLAVALLDPNIFRGALEYAGTFGISILFGAVPALMAWKTRADSRAAAPAKGGNKPRPAYDEVVPGGPVTLALVLLGAAVVIGQKLVA